MHAAEPDTLASPSTLLHAGCRCHLSCSAPRDPKPCPSASSSTPRPLICCAAVGSFCARRVFALGDEEGVTSLTVLCAAIEVSGAAIGMTP